LFSFAEKLFSISQPPGHQFSMLQAQSSHRAKEYLREDPILPELLSDNLLDVPVDIFSDSESESDDSVRVRQKLCDQNKVTVTVKQALRKVTILQIWGQPHG
jgi:hypothetical protein